MSTNFDEILGVECLAGNNSLGFGDSSDHDTDTKIFQKEYFYCTSACYRYRARYCFCKSVCLSVRHTLVSYLNECTYRQTLYRDPSFLIRYHRYRMSRLSHRGEG